MNMSFKSLRFFLKFKKTKPHKCLQALECPNTAKSDFWSLKSQTKSVTHSVEHRVQPFRPEILILFATKQ